MTNWLNRIIIYSILFFTSIFLTNSSLAVTTSISNIPSSISTDSFTFKVTVSGANSGINYLRVDLYKSISSNYFGETFNGLGWYSESDPTQYYSINIESGSDWTGEIQGKIGSPSSTQYDGPGIYRLRVRRYTSSGNYNTTEANNSATDINIDALLSTPTPNPTPLDTLQPIEGGEQLISPTSSLQPTTYENVYISEVMIYPEADNHEWIEIYNANEFEVVLDRWNIDDLENSGSTPKEFSLTVPAKNYNSYDLSGSVFNNGGDSVRLLDFNQKEIDSFQYESSEKGKTLGRITFDNDNFCLQKPSKNNINNSCLNPITIASKSTISLSPTINVTKSSLITSAITETFSTIAPKKFSLFNQNQSIISEPLEETNEEVLGANTVNQVNGNTQSQQLISSLTFTSFSYSVLSIISVLIKLKSTS